ncbi:hypothetical protein CC85DRAFT_238950, partial [Cutaneotrichosporon oleaginosum]
DPSFYDQGYADGHAHGAQHGVFEGRQLGREKAWEVWDELGFYEGYAGVWVRRLRGGAGRREAKEEERGDESKADIRSAAHATALLALISSFPTTNPSAGAAPTTAQDVAMAAIEADEEAGEAGKNDAPAPAGRGRSPDVDLEALLMSIRARYRLLCTSLGTRPRLTAAKDGSERAAVVEGIEGPMKGVDTRQLRF